MNNSLLISCITAAAMAIAPAAANASDTAHIAEVGPQFMTALDGTVVKIAPAGLRHRLVVRQPDGTFAPLPGAPVSTYRAVDLGHDGAGDLVLTYIRCDDGTNCRAFSDNLAGHRVMFQHLTSTRCDLTSAPARWRTRTAYGMACDKLTGPPNVFDPSRSGLFVKTGSGAPKRMRLPSGSPRFVDYADLRGTVVAGVAPSNESDAFTQNVDTTQLRSMQITDNQGETDSWSVMSMALGSSSRLWTLVLESQEEGDDVTQRISRLTPTSCRVEHVPALVDPDTQQTTLQFGALAVDANTLWLDTASGAITPPFNPTTGCL